MNIPPMGKMLSNSTAGYREIIREEGRVSNVVTSLLSLFKRLPRYPNLQQPHSNQSAAINTEAKEAVPKMAEE